MFIRWAVISILFYKSLNFGLVIEIFAGSYLLSSMAVVYLHKKADTNEVFYVGIGASRDRAYVTRGRNPEWHLIQKKHGHTVEIIHEGIAMESARDIERNLIAKYGRLDKGTGVLVNKSKGGDGVGYGPVKYTNYGNSGPRKIFNIRNKVTGKRYSSLKNAMFLTGETQSFILRELQKEDGIFEKI